MKLMRLAMRPPSGDDSDQRDDGDRGVRSFTNFLKRHFGPNFVPPAASRLSPGGGRPAEVRAKTDARKSTWLAAARAKSNALEARILASEKAKR
jgi:hypothetical protein